MAYGFSFVGQIWQSCTFGRVRFPEFWPSPWSSPGALRSLSWPRPSICCLCGLVCTSLCEASRRLAFPLRIETLSGRQSTPVHCAASRHARASSCARHHTPLCRGLHALGCAPPSACWISEFPFSLRSSIVIMFICNSVWGEWTSLHYCLPVHKQDSVFIYLGIF